VFGSCVRQFKLPTCSSQKATLAEIHVEKGQLHYYEHIVQKGDHIAVQDDKEFVDSYFVVAIAATEVRYALKGSWPVLAHFGVYYRPWTPVHSFSSLLCVCVCVVLLS
jgi:hypothetical protein